jgi:hypothetical protein
MWSDEEIKAAARDIAHYAAAAAGAHPEVAEHIVPSVRQRLQSAVPRWRPIESAPKDGTPVLILSEHDSGPYISIRRWVSANWIGGPASGWADEFCQLRRGLNPTHWMPLPEPPTDV